MLNKIRNIQKSIEHFNDFRIRELLFFSLIKETNNPTRQISFEFWDIIASEPSETDISSISWNWFCKIYYKCKGKKTRVYATNIFVIIIKNFKLNDKYDPALKRICISLKAAHTLQRLFDERRIPYNVIVYTSTVNLNLTQFSDANTKFLYDLLTQFMEENHRVIKRGHLFLMHFLESTGLQKINSIEDFNKDIFDNQLTFFEKINSELLVSILKNFYIMLLTIADENSIFTPSDNITITYLKHYKFYKYYRQNYQMINYNPFDDIPKVDKLLLIPNGEERKSRKIKKDSLIAVNFTVFKNDQIRFAYKHWFWNNKTNLLSRIEHLMMGAYFINYLSTVTPIDYKEKSNSPLDVSAVDIISYTQHVHSKGLNNLYITKVRSQLEYFIKNNLFQIKPENLIYFKSQYKEYVSNSMPITEEHSIAIIKELQSENTLKSQLILQAFLITISTELRPSEVFSISIDTLKADKNNNNYIELAQKTTSQQPQKINCTPFIKRVIDLSIALTSETRERCNEPEIKGMVFIHEAAKNKYRILDNTYLSRKIKNICKKLDLPDYSSENLRDTYMTNVLEFSIRNNLSIFDVKALTRHKSINTTYRSYSSLNVRKYLESTYNVLVDDPHLNGKIVEITDPDIKKENEVDDGCGYCPIDDCKLKDKLNCPLCDGYKVTIDRIPYFERKIAGIDEDILNSKYKHDKEHKTSIKSLYVAYLEQLILKSEEIKNAN